jgi:hypothetical protein
VLGPLNGITISLSAAQEGWQLVATISSKADTVSFSLII